MKAADWSSEGVFQKFYYRQYSAEFGSSVLAASASKSHVNMETEPSEAHNFQMAQVMQWPPGIRRKVRLKYRHVRPTQLYVLDSASKKSQGVKELAAFIGYAHVSLIVCVCILVFCIQTCYQ